MGDINAEPKDIPVLGEIMKEGWTDLGKNANWWGGTAAQPTCLANNSTGKPTSRDYAFACPALLTRIKGVNIHWEDTYATHAAVQVLVKLDGPPLKVNRNYKPLSLDEAVKDKVEEMFALDNDECSEEIKRKRTSDNLGDEI